jgi:hypothetical protein
MPRRLRIFSRSAAQNRVQVSSYKNHTILTVFCDFTELRKIGGKAGSSGKGQSSVRTIVSADNHQCGQLSVRTIVRKDICSRKIISKHIMLGIVGKVMTSRL